MLEQFYRHTELYTEPGFFQEPYTPISLSQKPCIKLLKITTKTTSFYTISCQCICEQLTGTLKSLNFLIKFHLNFI